jgi:hypothetical protein
VLSTGVTISVREAIVREKRIKGWSRAKKLALIQTTNPYWHDLAPGQRKADQPIADSSPAGRARNDDVG